MPHRDEREVYGVDSSGSVNGPALGGIRLSSIGQYPGTNAGRVELCNLLADHDESQHASYRAEVNSLKTEYDGEFSKLLLDDDGLYRGRRAYVPR